MKRTVDILPCFIRLIVSNLLQNLISRGFADFLAQYLSVLKEFWAVSRSQILSPCGFTNFSTRNHSNLNINNDLNRFFSTLLRMNHKMVLELKESRDKLLDYSSDLETKVEKRTADLKTANEQLSLLLESLRESEEKFRKLALSAQDAIIMLDNEGNFFYSNEAFERIFGYSGKEILGKELHRFIAPERYHEDYKKGFARFREIGEGPVIGKTLEVVAVKKDGTEFPIELSISALQFKGKWISIGMVRDITKRKRAEEELKRLGYLKEVILFSVGEGIFGLNVHGNHTFVNPAAAQMLGYTVDELMGRHSHTTWHYKKSDGSSYPVEECPIYAAFKDGRVHYVTEEVFWRKDGTSFPVEYTSTPIKEDEKIIGAVVTFRDISERKHMEEELRALSLVDELTGLYNRRGFLTLVKQQTKIADRMEKKMLLIFADIDKMKFINDTLGHEEGDRALIDTANILRKSLRDLDIIARFGGDEFVALAMEASDEHAEIIYSRLQDNIKSHNEKEVRPYKISLSLGFACYVPGSSIEELLVQADQLMYEDKQKKRVKSDET